MSEFSLDQIKDYMIIVLERIVKIAFPIASINKKKPVLKYTVIMDLQGLNVP